MITAYKKVEYTVIDIDKNNSTGIFEDLKTVYEDEYLRLLVSRFL